MVFYPLSGSARQHHGYDRRDRSWFVLAQGALQSVRALEGIGAGNLHLPAVASFRTQDHDPPVTRAVRHDVLDPCDQVALQGRVAGVLGFDRYWHTESLRHSGAVVLNSMRAGIRSRLFRSYGAWSFSLSTPRLASWALFFRRFAAGGS
jgi:hypothetical protein